MIQFNNLLWFCLVTVTSPLPFAKRDSSYGHADPSLKEVYEEEPNTEDVFSQILKTNKDSTIKLYHGDIVMPAHSGFSAMKCTDCLWKKSSDGTVQVPYTISSDYSDSDKAFIIHVLQDFSTLTCIQFVERSTEVDYLNIGSGSGCWSSVGKVGGSQYLSLLRTGCMARGIIQHEIQHALGFYHEQSRSDRDNYIDVLWEFINEDNWGNFEKVDTRNMDLPYDYSSVMHYGKYAYSNTSAQPTLRPKPDQDVEIGQRYGLSPLDVFKVKKLYECKQCSFMLTGTGGSLDSEKYIKAYSDTASCLWLITVEKNKVLLKFDTFDIPPSAGCSSYYITVYDGRSRKAPLLLDRVCGNQELPLLVATTNGLLVEFAYEETLPVFDFKATYSSVSCGGTYTADNGTITSPDYPNLYPNFADCVSTIWAPQGFRILLNFATFDLEYSSSCLYDYLIINDGGRPNAPELGRFCWDVHIPPILSTGNALLLQFHTDSWFNKAGYRADYSFVKSS
ncbi:astacin-like metalloendopeptidase [Spea bombifrons]|uniref:astacin-like metalloendopeptidase n=1 Tax=Spea bombifrons TaxID=233779 RepID=UPI00234B49B9|nr:astacin-like metalloendopeptidase [Spea bombifrons]